MEELLSRGFSLLRVKPNDSRPAEINGVHSASNHRNKNILTDIMLG